MDLILLTGSRGRVGSLLTEILERDGFKVIPVDHDSLYSKYILPTLSEVSDFNRIFVLHSGQPNAPRTRSQRKNYLIASVGLMEEANSKRFDFVFISSLSAHPSNRSHYSRDKLKLEKSTKNFSGKIIKLGIVTEIPHSYEIDIQRIQSSVSRFRLDFLFSSTSFYFTRGASLDNVSEFLLDSDPNSGTRCYFDSEEYLGTKASNIWTRLIANLAKFFIFSLSRLGISRADALLNLMEGMRIPR